MTESEKSIDCIICGSCVVDILVRPVPLETSIGGGRLIQVDPIEITTGGIVSNSGIAMSRLGMQAVALSYVQERSGDLFTEPPNLGTRRTFCHPMTVSLARCSA